MQNKDIQRLNSECILCLLNKHLKNIPENISEELKVKYIKRVLLIIARAKDNASAPEILEGIIRVQKNILGIKTSYTKIKHYYNQLMLSKEDEIRKEIKTSADSFKMALLYAMVGNYIDFGAMDTVNERKLYKMLSTVDDKDVNIVEIENLRQEIIVAKKLVYLTDNCGEIVLDKLFIEQIKKLNPSLEISVIVRGKDVLNDCTLTDSKEVGMHEIANVVSNGTAIAGTCLDKISAEAKDLIDMADVIISKGQGNFETLRFCGKNIYYLFLCKCEMIARRFNSPILRGMLLNDLRM